MAATGRRSENGALFANANEEIAELVWNSRYRAPGELTRQASFDRVAVAVSRAEKDTELWARRFKRLLQSGCFVPAGRILAGAGRADSDMMLNCFVARPPSEATKHTISFVHDVLLTLSAGGGVGFDLSPCAPACRSSDGDGLQGGPVGLLHLLQHASEVLFAAKSRRAAMSASLRCDHPDILDFIGAKKKPGTLTLFSLSVQITDAFLSAVETDNAWTLKFTGFPSTTLPARDVWQALARSAYSTGDPGILFTDHIARENPLGAVEEITATNPCGEVPLPPDGACVLGSIDLARFVRFPFTPEARLDCKAITRTAVLAVRFLDDVIDVSSYPLARQKTTARRTRRIGLGVMGLADALCMLGVRYDSDAGRRTAGRALETIRDAAYLTSSALALEKGACAACRPGELPQSGFLERLPQPLRERLAWSGRRNSHLLAIAPTGSISLLAGGASAGIEPSFGAAQVRQLRTSDGTAKCFIASDRAVLWWRKALGRAEGLPASFQDYRSIDPQAQMNLLGTVQRYVDQGISKTINLPEHCCFGEFRDFLGDAARIGLKGLTVYRPNGEREAVIKPGCSVSVNRLAVHGSC